MKGCARYEEMISRLIDGELPQAKQAELERHLASCPDCAALYKAFSALSETLGEEDAVPPARLHEAIMADVRREELRRRNTPRRRRGYLAAAACAAVILLAAVNLPRLRSAFLMGTAEAPAAAPAEVYSSAAAAEEVFDEATDGGDAPLFTASNNSIPAAPEPVPEPEEAPREAEAPEAAMPVPAPEAKAAGNTMAQAEPAQTSPVLPIALTAGLIAILAAVVLLLRKRRKS